MAGTHTRRSSAVNTGHLPTSNRHCYTVLTRRHVHWDGALHTVHHGIWVYSARTITPTQAVAGIGREESIVDVRAGVHVIDVYIT